VAQSTMAATAATSIFRFILLSPEWVGGLMGRKDTARKNQNQSLF
jgi:hypothetical protein